jgi:hypothetical protein
MSGGSVIEGGWEVAVEEYGLDLFGGTAVQQLLWP